ncbi:hypothetical protein CEUSTIGMA_g1615.t1 [Chlamydomonas eustigma]|uniref:Nudix hydrolase domain-containing protein n=1 Tax=Chlamydomonas eustigma TaxID=1157962 RepID=A0A250WTT6_9CHLO|nr:hypothetical protein CEUSTIGMA_g1615.t1 [Chlamydomonas eustigma]|eukprot:GAX74166.1 hypothetical protein CEUSTIGMA_g1615.t1 [Chlamydomonas eustigma]
MASMLITPSLRSATNALRRSTGASLNFGASNLKRAHISINQTQKCVASTSYSDEEYRPNVGICIVNSQGLVFSAQRCDDVQNTWQMPQGGIDEGEDPAVAALREVEEETSISSARIVGELDQWLTYDFPTLVRQRLHGGWQKYKGQKQKWFLVYFYGDDSEINIVTKEQEFKQWKWMKIEELPESVIPFKKDVYVVVAQQFAPMIKKLKESGDLSVKAALPT